MSSLKNLKNSIVFAHSLRRLKHNNNQERILKYFKEFLTNQKGLYIKLAQIIDSAGSENLDISTIPQPLDHEDFMRILKSSPTLMKSLKDINPNGYAASLSQVHQATTTDQQSVAIKVLYPGIKAELQDQLELINKIPSIGSIKRFDVNIDMYKRLIYKLIIDETDFKNELENLAYFNSKVEIFEDIVIPSPMANLCNDDILVMSWVDGKSIHELPPGLSQERKNQFGNILLRFFIRQFLFCDRIHIDPNKGNFLFIENPHPQIALLDFGSCYKITNSSFSLALCRLIYSAIYKESVNLMGIFQLLGFEIDKLSHIENRIPYLVQLLSEPFCNNSWTNLNNWDFKQKLEKALGELRWWFRSSGGMDFFIAQKYFYGMFNLLKTLNCNLNFQKIFLEETAPLKNQVYSLEIPQIETLYKMSSLAEHLHILVKENGLEKVKITLPISAVNHLNDFLSEETLKKIEKKNFSIKDRIDSYIANGCQKESLFYFEDLQTNKIINVWTT
ncbi:MAG: hypothetical protein KDD50_08195, partial [Bdellovibrionales bacterium]|nr:hypothetical protein [Bdellovibrionales bacterium]